MTRAALLLSLFLLTGCGGSPLVPPSPAVPSTTGTHVRLMRGLGGAALSPGVDQIAALVAKIPGVTQVQVYEYTQSAQIAAEVNAEPLSVKEVIGGYSCGANASPIAAAAVSRTVDEVAVIQESEWCGGTPLTPNVLHAQETYDPNCLDTAGLGCKKLDVGPGFNPGNLTIIVRPDCHPCADTDLDAQNDIVLAVRSVTNASARLSLAKARGVGVPGAPHTVVRRRGQPLYAH